MSTLVEQAVAACEPATVEPVELTGDALESTAPEYLRDVKRALASEGYQVVELTVESCVREDCSLATQREADRLRGYVRAASVLGAGTVTVSVTAVENAAKVRPALSALEERARLEGVTLTVEGLELPT